MTPIDYFYRQMEKIEAQMNILPAAMERIDIFEEQLGTAFQGLININVEPYDYEKERSMSPLQGKGHQIIKSRQLKS